MAVRATLVKKKDEFDQKDNVTVHCAAGQNDGFDDDQDNGSVEVLAIQKVEVLSHVKVDVGSDGDEGHTRQEEDEVDEKDYVTEHCVTTTHFESCKVKSQISFCGKLTGIWYKFPAYGKRIYKRILIPISVIFLNVFENQLPFQY